MISLSKYVIQEHTQEQRASTPRHYDLRIEIPRKKLLASWSIPKCEIPKKYKDRVMAIRGFDHGKYWLFFQGDIPEGESGEGNVKILETGEAEILGWSNRFITFVGKGNMLHGKYHLTLLPEKGNPNAWILLKGKD